MWGGATVLQAAPALESRYTFHSIKQRVTYMIDIQKNLILTHKNVTVRTIELSDEVGLTEAAADPQIWVLNPDDDQMAEPMRFKSHWFDVAFKEMRSKYRWPFVVIQDDVIVGSLSFYDHNQKNKSIVIGYAWYVPACWGRGTHPAAMYLLLSYAFDVLGMIRVSFTADEKNSRSRQSLVKMGATEEGILRKERVMPDGQMRHTVVYSILDDEWQIVKSTLEKQVC